MTSTGVPTIMTNLGIDGRPKPRFNEGEPVAFDFGTGEKGRGKIRGLVTEHVIDFWIIEVTEFEGIDKERYPWSCISVPHPRITRI